MKEFDKQLNMTIQIQKVDYSYKRLISKEVHELSNYIREKSTEYNPFLMNW